MGTRGGKREGAGRKPGAVSAAKRELADMAKTYAEAALKTLADIAAHGESEAARVSAAIAILDRAYGKPPQAMELTGAGGASLVPAINVTIGSAEPSSSSKAG